jgi:hypothetical protein
MDVLSLHSVLNYRDIDVYNGIWQLRKAMRVDLGVSEWWG